VLLVGFAHARATDVAMCTDLGRIVIRIDDEHAPAHAANFLSYVDNGHYIGSVFHRVIDGFMIQGGGYDRQLRAQPSGSGIQNESKNGASNSRGTIAAARTSDPHSAADQFFINLVDNNRLDGDARNWGYTVFGEVTTGMDVVDRIGSLPTRGSGPFATDVPDPLVAIRSVARTVESAETDQVDWPEIVLNGITDALAQGDYNAAMTWFGRYRATCNAVDAAFMLDEATSATAVGQTEYARKVLTEYFAIVEPSDADFERATALFAVVAPGESPIGSTGFGSCIAPMAPAIPDGTREDLSGMIEAQDAVRAFMQESNGYLECLDEIIDDKNFDAAARKSAVDEYNRSVEVTQTVGEQFNTQVRAFRARESARDR
jgi:cyclophilin family peptidyl-prolyl cis-trans isomerase